MLPGKASLHTAFSAMEEAHKSRLFLKELVYERSQTRGIVFYKDIVKKKNVSASQLESMLATYKAEKKVPEQIRSNFSYRLRSLLSIISLGLQFSPSPSHGVLIPILEGLVELS